jgi:antitoxin component YwqK of YwqJK toxin-antitoxin module
MRLITIILLLFSFQLFAQKVKQVKHKTSKYEYETYTTIKEKGKTAYRQGDYKRVRYRSVVEFGTYDQGKKVGKWVNKTGNGHEEFYYTMGQLDSFYGNKDKDVVGIKYDNKGKEVFRYYYSSLSKIVTERTSNGWRYAKLTNYGFVRNDTIAKGYIRDDKMDGIWEFKNADRSFSTLHFKKDHLIGNQSSFYANGNPYSTLSYNDSSELHGPYLIQYQNGDTLFYQNYVNGKQHGHGTAKYENGKTYYTVAYNHGKVLAYNEYNVGGADLQKSKIENGSGQILEYAWVNGQIKVNTLTNYTDGVPNGTRFHFNADTVSYSEKYENGVFVSYGIEPSYKIARDENDTIFPRVNFDMVDSTKLVKSSFHGGEDGLQRFIAENITYPPMALENDVQGKVNVMFVVDRLGGVLEPSIIRQKLGFGLEEEAIRVITATNGMWTPAIYYGIPVKMRFKIPIKYQIF